MEYYVTKLSTLKQKGKMRVMVNNQPILLVLFDEDVFAIRDKCPHMGAMLSSGLLEEGVISCKDHGLKISVVTGEVVDQSKAEFLKLDEYSRSVRKYKTIIRNESIYLEV